MLRHGLQDVKVTTVSGNARYLLLCSDHAIMVMMVVMRGDKDHSSETSSV